MYIRTKNDLINLAETYLSIRYVSILRALHEGSIENLGAFRHVTGGRGWVLKITSKFKSVYYLAIVTDYLNYRIAVLNKVSWEYWEGDKSDNKLYQGDNPENYKLLRDKRLGENKNAYSR